MARAAVPKVAARPGTSSSAAFRHSLASRVVSGCCRRPTRSAMVRRDAASKCVEKRIPSSPRRATIASSVCICDHQLHQHAAGIGAAAHPGRHAWQAASSLARSSAPAVDRRAPVAALSGLRWRRLIAARDGRFVRHQASGVRAPGTAARARHELAGNRVARLPAPPSVMPRKISRSPGASSTRRSCTRIRSTVSNAAAPSPSSA